MTEPDGQEGELLTPSSLRVPRDATNNFWYQHTEADTAVVFVHGIFSDSRSCWLAAEGSRGAVFWPDLVRSDLRLGNPSIFMAGYYTAFDAGDFPLNQCAKEVMDALERPDARGTPAPMKKQALVFVCHSTGGIVMRYVLDKHRERFARKRVGLALIASPSRGSGWANFGALAFHYYNQKLGLQLQLKGDTVEDLHNRFRDLVHDKARLMPGLFGMEACESRMVFKNRLATFFGFNLPTRLKVVTTDSAGQYFGEVKVLRDTDHFTAVKPTSLQHPSHEFLVNFIQAFEENFRVVSTALAGEPSQPDDRRRLYREALRLLEENRVLHRRYGPDSENASNDPFGEGASMWHKAKIETLIPNNRAIVRLFDEHLAQLPPPVWTEYLAFKMHAQAFEASSDARLDRGLQPHFPEAFETMLLRELQLPLVARPDQGEKDTGAIRRVNAFEKSVRHNKATAQITCEGPLYHVELKNGRMLTLVLVDAVEVDDDAPGDMYGYTVGRNDVTELVGSFRDVRLDYIVTLSSYNQYTARATETAETYGIKLMTGDEFINELSARGR